MYETSVHLQPPDHIEASLLHSASKGVFRLRGRLLSLTGLPQIYFGREEGVERTLLSVACQSETFLVPPWQRGIDIRVLWHLGCQSDFDELVSLASRMVKGQFGRTKVLIAEVQAQSSRLIELGAALVSKAGPSVIFRLRVGLGDAGRPELVSSRGGTYFDFNKKGKTIRAERAASPARGSCKEI